MLSKILVCGIYWNWARKQLQLAGVLIPIKVDGLEFYLTLITPHIWSGPCTSHPSKGLISSCLDKPLHPFVLKGLYQGQWLRYFTNCKGPPRCTILQTPKCERGVWIFASSLTITIFFFLAKAPKTGPPSKDRTHTRRAAAVVVAGWPPAFPPMWSQEAKTRVREDLPILTRTEKIRFARRSCGRSRQPGNFAIFRYLWSSRNARDARDFVTEPRWFIIALFGCLVVCFSGEDGAAGRSNCCCYWRDWGRGGFCFFGVLWWDTR